MTTNNTFEKDPQAILDFKFDWASRTNGTVTEDDIYDWLQPGETIVSYTITTNPSNSKIRLAMDKGDNGINSVYNNVTLGGSALHAGFNGINSNVDIYSDKFVSHFDGNEATFILNYKVSGSGIWIDGKNRWLATISYYNLDNQNNIDLIKTSDGEIYFRYNTPTGQNDVFYSLDTSVGWNSIGVTWSKESNQLKAYRNGIQEGTTQTLIGSWSTKELFSEMCKLGMPPLPSPTGTWSGWLSDFIISFGVMADDTDMFMIANDSVVNGLTHDDLDAVFGKKNYLWYRLDESDEIFVDNSSLTDGNTSVTVWLSQGINFKDYDITCKIVTSESRIDERTMKIQVRDR